MAGAKSGRIAQSNLSFAPAKNTKKADRKVILTYVRNILRLGHERPIVRQEN